MKLVVPPRAPRPAPSPSARRGGGKRAARAGLEQHAPTGTLKVPAGTAGAEAAGGNLRAPLLEPSRASRRQLRPSEVRANATYA